MYRCLNCTQYLASSAVHFSPRKQWFLNYCWSRFSGSRHFRLIFTPLIPAAYRTPGSTQGGTVVQYVVPAQHHTDLKLYISTGW